MLNWSLVLFQVTLGKKFFYVDLEANLAQNNVKRALEELKEVTEYVRILGCYPSESMKAVQVINNDSLVEE